MASNQKLLVADDSLTIQKVIRLALSSEGYDIQTVSDGNDAIQQISLFRPNLVLIDVSLPGKTAFEVKSEINKQGDFDDLKFILMSSAFESVDETQIEQAGFHGRLTKPFDPAHLRKIISDVLAQIAARRTESTSLLDKNEMEKGVEEIDLLPPIAPPSEELISPPPFETTTENLWDGERPVEIVLPSSDNQGSSDSDIKNLTESTIRMSGLDELNWSVNENARKNPPPLPPQPEMSDLGNTTFKFDLPSIDPPTMDTEETAPIELAKEEPVVQIIQPPPAPLLKSGEGPRPTESDPNVVPLTQKQMEEMLQQQLQITLEKMAQKLLPDLAEKIVKQEINRLLNETL